MANIQLSGANALALEMCARSLKTFSSQAATAEAEHKLDLAAALFVHGELIDRILDEAEVSPTPRSTRPS